ncbi:MAG: hypothetical protein DSZ29_02955 [Aquificaceae bacterium]|nr:MAG: hypothetical protein DSZ29_02955 [Aquificaceae bacterium]
MNRRQFLASSIMTALGLSSCGGGGGSVTQSTNTGNGGNTGGGSSTGNTNTGFENPLLIPEELIGKEINGRIHYNLSLQKGVSNFLSSANTPTWGINGNYLGPTLRLKNGSKVDINYHNNLDEDTTIHGHGMHLPAKMDGAAHQVIKSGKSWTSAYTVKQHACTNWYHPHLMDGKNSATRDEWFSRLNHY